ncbi:MAG: hypothetical protein ABEI77_00320 [Halorientalis sp.]
MATLAEKVSVGILVVVGVAYAVLPAQVSGLLSPGTTLIVDAIMWADKALPEPVFISLVFLVTTVVSILIAISFGRVLYTLLKYGGPRTKRAWEFITPSTPIGKVVVGIGLLVAVVFGSVSALPYFLHDFGTKSTVGKQADQLVHHRDRALEVLQQDAPTAGGNDAAADVQDYQRPNPDTDGDQLKDSWERAGQTPDGVPLPGADPNRMDLYVQLNYGGGTYLLSKPEKQQLRRVWREMPVKNPDGSTGITLHIDDQPPHGGALGTQVSVSGSAKSVSQYYTSRYLGKRQCRYHQIIVGGIDESGLAGIANGPGYAAVVEDNKSAYDGNVSRRVHVITHELLHNVAAPVGHTDSGWLYPYTDSSQEHLSKPTEKYIENHGFSGSGYYQQHVC